MKLFIFVLAIVVIGAIIPSLQIPGLWKRELRKEWTMTFSKAQKLAAMALGVCGMTQVSLANSIYLRFMGQTLASPGVYDYRYTVELDSGGTGSNTFFSLIDFNGLTGTPVFTLAPTTPGPWTYVAGNGPIYPFYIPPSTSSNISLGSSSVADVQFQYGGATFNPTVAQFLTPISYFDYQSGVLVPKLEMGYVLGVLDAFSTVSTVNTSGTIAADLNSNGKVESNSGGSVGPDPLGTAIPTPMPASVLSGLGIFGFYGVVAFARRRQAVV